MSGKLMTLAEAKQLLGLPDFCHALNDEGHRLIGSEASVLHFKEKFNAATKEEER